MNELLVNITERLVLEIVNSSLPKDLLIIHDFLRMNGKIYDSIKRITNFIDFIMLRVRKRAINLTTLKGIS